jgi:hypothetical protein
MAAWPADPLPLGDLRNVFPRLKRCNRKLGERGRQEALLFLAAEITGQAVRNVVFASPSSEFRQRSVRITPHMLGVRRGLREVWWVFMFILDAGAEPTIKIVIGPMFSPLDAHTAVRNKRGADRRLAVFRP